MREAATSSIALVICAIFRVLRMRRRISRKLAIFSYRLGRG
jgi:hypothetical protein